MATATPKAYETTSGGVIYGGRYKPGLFGTMLLDDKVLSGGFEVVAPVLPLALTQVVAAPQFWTQFSRPQVVRSGNFVYLGHTNMDGDSLISQYNLTTSATVTFTLDEGSGPNGHDSSVIGILPDGRILAVWSVHNSGVFRRISTNPHDITAFGASARLPSVAGTSYANLFYLSTPNRWYVHTRYGNGGGPGDRPCEGWSSSDGGVSWGSSTVRWLTQPGERPYVISCNNGVGRVDFVCAQFLYSDTNGPLSGQPSRIYHCYMTVAADGQRSFFRSDGTAIGSSVTNIQDQCTVIDDGAGGSCLPWDIAYGDDGLPRVLWCRIASVSDHRHMFARWTGSSWAATDIGSSGPAVYSGTNDVALTFDGLGVDCIVRGVWVGSAVECQDWRSADNGATWTKFADITTGSAVGQKVVSPVKITNADGRVSRAIKRGTINAWWDFNLAINIMGRSL